MYRKEDNTMTKLELRICEAENMGEIDLDTRDMMLNVIGESTAQVRQAVKIDKQINEVYDKIQNLKNLRYKFKREGNQRMVDETDKKIKKLEKEEQELYKRRDRIDPGRHASVAKYLAQIASTHNAKSDHVLRDGFIDRGRASAKKNPWRGNSKREEREPGMYKTTNGLKESVLEEIYEAELCGDITAEERMALIDYMSE